MQRDEREKRPIQASETDAGQLSIGFNSFSETPQGNVAQTGDQRYQLNESHTEYQRNLIVSGTGVRRPAKYPNYDTKVQRNATFNTTLWSKDNKPSPDDLTEWGFFFTGNQDLVRCHQCGIGLKDWTEDDDVMREHVKHSPTCSFLLNKLGKEIIYQIKATADNPDASDAAPLPYKIRSPRYQNMAARISSFRNFPSHVQISHHLFAVAGLFYTGKGDLCRCFTCDGGLKDWTTGDDPIKEHATYFPNCAYINQLKGTEYVTSLQRHSGNNMGAAASSGSNVQERQADQELRIQNLTIQDSSFAVTQVIQKLGYTEADVFAATAELKSQGKFNPTAEDLMNMILDMKERITDDQSIDTRHNNGEDLKAIAEENKELSKTVYCMLCVTGESDILFLPCSHHRVCHKCSVGIIYCPVCDSVIQEKVKTFRS